MFAYPFVAATVFLTKLGECLLASCVVIPELVTELLGAFLVLESMFASCALVSLYSSSFTILLDRTCSTFRAVSPLF